MPILIVEHNGNVEGTSLSGRVLIGRRPSNHVVIDDPAVSRIHAWIDTADHHYCLVDAGSRTGTFVNGHRVTSDKVHLSHGDRITVGPAKLTFRTDATLPAGVSQLNFDEDAAGGAGGGGAGGQEPTLVDGGILFNCTCGSPLWIAAEFAGRLGRCRFCGEVIGVPVPAGLNAGGVPAAADAAAAIHATRVPAQPAPDADRRVPGRDRRQGRGGAIPPSGRPTDAAPASPSPAAPTHACGVCQSPIAAGEAMTPCPSCGLTFHADCWTENHGCSAYGCPQVNALTRAAGEATASPDAVAAPVAVTDPSVGEGHESSHATTKVTAEYALLAASVVGVALGALTFGVPALLALVAVIVYAARRRKAGGRASRVVLLAGLLAVLGVAAGVGVSYVWWLRGTPYNPHLLIPHRLDDDTAEVVPSTSNEP